MARKPDDIDGDSWSGGRVTVCGTTRLLLPAFFVGLAVATFGGNDLLGWIAAAATVAVLAVIPKVRGASQTCAVSPPPASPTRHDEVEPGAGGRTDLSAR